MSDFEEKLNAILSSPETMAQVMSIAQSLGMNGEAPPSQPEQNTPSQADDIAGLFSSLDPAMLTRLLPLLGELQEEHSSREQHLLAALSPYLKESRQEKLQQALRMAKLITAGKKLMGALGEKNV